MTKKINEQKRAGVLEQTSMDLPKRKYPRVSFDKPLAMICKGQAEVTQAHQIGEGGVSFITDFIFELESEVVVNFYIPGGDFFCLRAVIKNITQLPQEKFLEKIIYGASFTETSLALKRQIRAYVARSSHNQDKFKIVF